MNSPVGKRFTVAAVNVNKSDYTHGCAMDNCYAVRADLVNDSLVIPNTTLIEYHLKEQSELATLVLEPIAHEKGHLSLNCDFECITDMSY